MSKSAGKKSWNALELFPARGDIDFGDWRDHHHYWIVRGYSNCMDETEIWKESMESATVEC